MTASNAEKVLAKLRQSGQSGRLDGLEIEYWVGGGLPPPRYRSDQLRLLCVDGRDTVEFAKMCFDDHYDPPSLNEKWQVPATGVDVREMVRLLLEGSVFTTHYPEEDDPGIADILSTEVIATFSGDELKRRYYRKPPESLAPLVRAAEALIDRAKREGERGLYHQGKRVGD